MLCRLVQTKQTVCLTQTAQHCWQRKQQQQQHKQSPCSKESLTLLSTQTTTKVMAKKWKLQQKACCATRVVQTRQTRQALANTASITLISTKTTFRVLHVILIGISLLRPLPVLQSFVFNFGILVGLPYFILVCDMTYDNNKNHALAFPTLTSRFGINFLLTEICQILL